MKRIALLGSTGSIGKQVIEVLERNSFFKLVAVSAHSNSLELKAQQKKYAIPFVALGNNSVSPGFDEDCQFFSGINWYKDLIDASKPDNVIIALTGFEAIFPVNYCLEKGITVLLANKEAVVAGGSILMPLAQKTKTQIIPIDSEHSAIFQCLQGEQTKNIHKVYLTASGGPFLTTPKDELKNISPEQAINHPVWRMGPKISVDSATMMNKGLEAIEAHWLFGINASQIDFVIHPAAVVHSMVQFVDGSIKAQLSHPDMRIPISYALSYPDRIFVEPKPFNWQNLEFKALDRNQFEAINIAMHALSEGGAAPCILNAANEAAVKAFINKKITFTDITKIVSEVLLKMDNCKNPDLDDLTEIHFETINFVNKKINK
jgi:1-deoxy-D-xylulose-5-phosphate reductoisomerase